MTDVIWKPMPGFEDIKYEKSPDGIAKITINRPEVRNAFRPQTVKELISTVLEKRKPDFKKFRRLP